MIPGDGGTGSSRLTNPSFAIDLWELWDLLSQNSVRSNVKEN